MSRNLSRLSLPVALLCLAACGGPGPDVLAGYRGGQITVGDLDAFIRALPERQRVAPEQTSREAWLEEQLHRAALQRILADSEIARQRLADPGAEAWRRWQIAQRLAAAVTQELARDAAPDERAVAEWLDAPAAAADTVPRSSFRHIFFRLDRAAGDVEREAIRERAGAVARRARAGEDFAELARRHSQSNDAASGGLAANQRPGDLEETVRRAVEALDEGEVSELVETRTGLHVFRLERRIYPRPASREQREQRARGLAVREAVAAARAALLAEVRERVEPWTDAFPWRVGSFELSEAELGQILPATAGEGQREWVVEQLLLAEEGRRRGLLTPALEAEVASSFRHQAIQAAYQDRRAQQLAALSVERFRAVYEAQPSGFATKELAHLDLIFVRQSRDAFAVQRRLEDHVAELRAGGDFAELARRISEGPGAAEGGDLGLLPPSEWARLNPAIYGTVVAMEAGEISDPAYLTDRVMTRDPRTLVGGFAVLRVREKRPPRERGFEEAVDDVRAAWVRQNAAALDQELRESVLAEAGFRVVRLPDPAELAR